MADGAPRQRKLRNLCTASDYEELRKAYRFVPEAEPASAGTSAGTSAAQSQSADASTASTWQSRMARRYESHLYREFVLADLTRYQSGQVGLRWRTRDEVSYGKGFDTCGNKHCPSFGSGSRDVEAARRASLSRTSEESVRRYHLNAQKCHEQATTSKESQQGAENEEEEEMAALSQLPYGCGLADYELPFSYVEQEISKTELVKLRLCLRCAPMLFFGRGGALGAKMARERLNSAQNIGSTKQQLKEDEEEDASSDLSRSSHSTGHRHEDKRRKRRGEKGRKRKKDTIDRKRGEDRERRRRKKSGHSRRKAKKKKSGSDSSDDTGFNSDDSSIKGRRAEEGLLASLAESSQK